MKTRTFWIWSLGLGLAVLPLAGGCDQESAHSQPAVSDTNDEAAGDTNTAPAEAAEQQLEQAPGEVVSTPSAPPAAANMSSPANEIAKLAQSGVDETVMLSFVTNSPHTFNLSSDAIIYLNDIGVPSTVVTAMIQHDDSVRQSSAQAVSPPPAPAPYAPPLTPPETAEPQPPVIESGQPADTVNGSYSYFYGSLAPYGNWIQVNGYGMCWQPTVVVADHAWRPYCDRGHWAYTDSGWCWVSDYTWGWAPFHYGRWFHHNRWGWCWAPDTVWGPSWVSWRYGDAVCGWAPLPPVACFTPGIGLTCFGRHVGFGFSFGLSANLFTFVGFDHFTDQHWHHFRVSEHEVGGFFHRTRIANNLVERHHSVVNEGVPLNRVVAATHRDVPRIHIRETGDPARARLDRVERPGGSLTVFRPNLPAPTRQTTFVGQGIRPRISAGPGTRVLSSPGSASRAITRPGVSSPGMAPIRSEPSMGSRNSPGVPSQDRSRSGISAQGPGTAASPANSAPLIQRNWERPASPSAAPPLVPNNSRVISRGSPQPTIRAQSPPSVPSESPRVLRQDSPKYLQQDQRIVTPRVTPALTPNAARPYQWAPAAEPQQHWVSPAERSVPPIRSQPAPAAPQHIQSAPPARSYSPPAAARGSGQDNNNSRHNR